MALKGSTKAPALPEVRVQGTTRLQLFCGQKDGRQGKRQPRSKSRISLHQPTYIKKKVRLRRGRSLPPYHNSSANTDRLSRCSASFVSNLSPAGSSEATNHWSSCGDLQQRLSSMGLHKQLLLQLQRQQQERREKRREKQRQRETQKARETEQLQALQQRFASATATLLPQQLPFSDPAAAATAAACLLARIRASKNEGRFSRERKLQVLTPAGSQQRELQRQEQAPRSPRQMGLMAARSRLWDRDSSSISTSGRSSNEHGFDRGNADGARKWSLRESSTSSSTSRRPLPRGWSSREARCCLKPDFSLSDGRDSPAASTLQQQQQRHQQQQEEEQEHRQQQGQQQAATTAERKRHSVPESSEADPSGAIHSIRRSPSSNTSSSSSSSSTPRKRMKDCGIQVSLHIHENLGDPAEGLQASPSNTSLSDPEYIPASASTASFVPAACGRRKAPEENPDAAVTLTSRMEASNRSRPRPFVADEALQPRHRLSVSDTSIATTATKGRNPAAARVSFPAQAYMQQGEQAEAYPATGAVPQRTPAYRQQESRYRRKLWCSTGDTAAAPSATCAAQPVAHWEEELQLYAQQDTYRSFKSRSLASESRSLPTAGAAAAGTQHQARGIPLVCLMREKYCKWQRRKIAKSVVGDKRQQQNQRRALVGDQPLPFLLGRGGHHQPCAGTTGQYPLLGRSCSPLGDPPEALPGGLLDHFDSESYDYRGFGNSLASPRSYVDGLGRCRSRYRMPLQQHSVRRDTDSSRDMLEASLFQVSNGVAGTVKQRIMGVSQAGPFEGVTRSDSLRRPVGWLVPMRGTSMATTLLRQEGSGSGEWKGHLSASTQERKILPDDHWFSDFPKEAAGRRMPSELKLEVVSAVGTCWKREAATLEAATLEAASERQGPFQPALHCSIASLASSTPLPSVSCPFVSTPILLPAFSTLKHSYRSCFGDRALAT